VFSGIGDDRKLYHSIGKLEANWGDFTATTGISPPFWWQRHGNRWVDSRRSGEKCLEQGPVSQLSGDFRAGFQQDPTMSKSIIPPVTVTKW